jgi:predicted nucleic acid-binding protein
MKRLFVDTGAFVAKEIAGDPYHTLAAHCWREIEDGNYQLVSSEHIFDECVTLLARRTNYAWAAEWGNDVLDAGIEWLRTDVTEWRQALLLMRKYADQGVSFTDCLSAVLMKRVGCKQIFGFDRHFESLGFRVWPSAI